MFFAVIDCVVSPWGPWSACDVECGSGTMSRSRTVEVQPRNGGRRCPSLDQRRGCQVSNCQHHKDTSIKGKIIVICMYIEASVSYFSSMIVNDCCSYITYTLV